MKIVNYLSLSLILVVLISGTVIAATESKHQNKETSSSALSNLDTPRFFQDQQELERLYKLSGNQLIWSKAGKPTPQSFEAIQSLQQAQSMGLKTEKYATDQLLYFWNEIKTPFSENKPSLAEFDMALSDSLMQFISDLYLGIVSSGYFDDEMAAGIRSGKLRIRQRPGKSNALGLIKFIFPNSNSVYLHDTPARSLFSQSRRDFSHGCIRVEDPVRLAEFVLGQQEQGWSRGDIMKAMQGENDQKIFLTKKIPVHIFYTTAIVRENGDISFFEDIYGHDERLEMLLRNNVQN